MSIMNAKSHAAPSWYGQRQCCCTKLERQTNFKVVIRVRHLCLGIKREVPFQNTIAIDERSKRSLFQKHREAFTKMDGNNPGPFSTHNFVFDHVYDQNSTQRLCLKILHAQSWSPRCKGTMQRSLHGQTGTGKTFTMEGFNVKEL